MNATAMSDSTRSLQTREVWSDVSDMRDVQDMPDMP